MELNNALRQELLHQLSRLRLLIFPYKSRREAVYCRYLRPSLSKLFLSSRRQSRLELNAPLWCVIARDDGSNVVKGTGKKLDFSIHLRPGEVVRFDLNKAVEQLPVSGLALVFFMGLGDYLFTTPFLAELRHKFASMPIYAYVSKNLDRNNSPLVATLLTHDPNVDKVEYYDGRPSKYDYRNYDYQEVFLRAPKGFLIVPIIHECAEHVRHRLLSLFDAFSLPEPSTIAPPIIHLPSTISLNVQALLERIIGAYNGHEGLIFLQLETRSSNYRYRYADELARHLVNRGYLVVSVTRLMIDHPSFFQVNTCEWSIVDSIQLVKLIHAHLADELTFITVTSVFSAVAAGLNIRNIQMQHYYDPGMHNVWYPANHLIAHKDYPAIPRDMITLATRDDYTVVVNNKVGTMVDYLPPFVIEVMETVKGFSPSYSPKIA
jgi:hypothetical protein